MTALRPAIWPDIRFAPAPNVDARPAFEIIGTLPRVLSWKRHSPSRAEKQGRQKGWNKTHRKIISIGKRQRQNDRAVGLAVRAAGAGRGY
jgi:hypothetical protein